MSLQRDQRGESVRELLSEQRRSREAFEQMSLAVPPKRIRRERDLRSLTVERTDDTRDEQRHRSAEYLSVKSELHQRLLDELDERNLLGSREDELEAFIAGFVANVLAVESIPLNELERSRLHDDCLEETSGVGGQVEDYACLSASRVANFLSYSPLQWFRSPRDHLPPERVY